MTSRASASRISSKSECSELEITGLRNWGVNMTRASLSFPSLASWRAFSFAVANGSSTVCSAGFAPVDASVAGVFAPGSEIASGSRVFGLFPVASGLVVTYLSVVAPPGSGMDGNLASAELSADLGAAAAASVDPGAKSIFGSAAGIEGKVSGTRLSESLGVPAVSVLLGIFTAGPSAPLVTAFEDVSRIKALELIGSFFLRFRLGSWGTRRVRESVAGWRKRIAASA